MDYTVNTASGSELLSFLQLASPEHSPSLDSAVDLAEYAAKIARNGVVFEAWEGTRLIGICAGYFNDLRSRSCFITLIHVFREFQGQGIGTELLLAAIRYARRKNFLSMSLMVNRNNGNAQRFYQKLGFRCFEENDLQYGYRLMLEE